MQEAVANLSEAVAVPYFFCLLLTKEKKKENAEKKTYFDQICEHTTELTAGRLLPRTQQTLYISLASIDVQ